MTEQTNTIPKATYAFTERHEIRLVPMPCPFCRRMLQAYDVKIPSFSSARLTCSSCHQDVLMIGAAL
jgi:hypothetical protein